MTALPETPPQPAIGAHRILVPLVTSTILVTLFFSLFGLIPAIGNSRRARELGAPTPKYWIAFGVTFVINAVIWIMILMATVFAATAVTVNAIDSSIKEVQASAAVEIPGTLGKPVENAGMTYKVNSVKKMQTLPGYGETLKPKLRGSFVVVDLTLTNTKNETKSFLDDTATLRTKNGLSYSPTNDYIFNLNKTMWVAQEVQPGLPTNALLVYEVPTEVLPGSSIVITDFWGNGKIVVPTNLK